MDNDDVIGTLNDLIETCTDGEYGFRACAGQAKATQLQSLFQRRAADCALAATQLKAHVVQLGGTPETGGSAGGAMHRGWVAVRSTLTTYDDRAVLDECERGEDVALDAYRNALKDELPPRVRELVQLQYEGVKRNHDEVRALRDQFRAA